VYVCVCVCVCVWERERECEGVHDNHLTTMYITGFSDQYVLSDIESLDISEL
jgi:hypothetical protein